MGRPDQCLSENPNCVPAPTRVDEMGSSGIAAIGSAEAPAAKTAPDRSPSRQRFLAARVIFVVSVAALLLANCVAQVRPAETPEDLSAIAQRARAALLSDRIDDAIGLYQRLVLALPAESGARLNLAMALHSAGRYKESVAQLERLRVSQASNARFWFLLGVGYLKLEQPVKAVEPLSRSVRLDRSYGPGRLELASALLESGSLEKAEAAFLSYAADESGSAKAWQGLAICRLELSREAAVALDKLAPESSFRYGLAALAESSQGNTTSAAKLYEKALAAQPPAAWMQAELAASASSKSNVEADESRDVGHPLAVAFFQGDPQRVLRLSALTQSPEGLYWRSRAYAEMARRAVERLSALPHSSEQHELMGIALERAGRRSDAVAEWREAVRMSPGDLRLRAALARSLRLNRQFDEASSILQELVRMYPARADWQFQLGDSLRNQGRPEQALPYLRRAVELRPDMLSAQALLGELLLQAGNAQAAVVHLERALPLDRDGSLHLQLAGAYRQLGKLELAGRALRRQREIQAAAAGRQMDASPSDR